MIKETGVIYKHAGFQVIKGELWKKEGNNKVGTLEKVDKLQSEDMIMNYGRLFESKLTEYTYLTYDSNKVIETITALIEHKHTPDCIIFDPNSPFESSKIPFLIHVPKGYDAKQVGETLFDEEMMPELLKACYKKEIPLIILYKGVLDFDVNGLNQFTTYNPMVKIIKELNI